MFDVARAGAGRRNAGQRSVSAEGRRFLLDTTPPQNPPEPLRTPQNPSEPPRTPENPRRTHLRSTGFKQDSFRTSGTIQN